MKQEYTLIVYTENYIGLLNHISIIFTRRNININSLTTSESARKGIYKFTIVVELDEKTVKTVTKQIGRIIDVLRAYYHTEDEVFHQELALYKVPTSSLINGTEVEKLVRMHNARIMEIHQDYTVIEKTGHKKDTQELFEKLQEFGVTQFVRSGRVAIARDRENIAGFLEEIKEYV